jgi:GH18 family chitinase
MPLALLLLAASGAGATGTTTSTRLRSVGWYRIDDPWYGCVPPEEVHWDALTHIAIASPKIAADYTASCVLGARENHTMTLARQHGVKVIWIVDEAVFPCNNRTEMLNQTRRNAFLRSIGKAAAECGIDGVDGDYEGWDDPARPKTTCTAPGGGSGVGTSCDRDVYTSFLNDIRDALNAARPPVRGRRMTSH